MTPDPAWLEDVLRYLPWEHQTRLSACFEPKWKTRQRRLELRAEAVRNALETLYPGWKKTVATTALARDYGRYIASAWRHEQNRNEVPTDWRNGLFWRIAKLNDGGAMAASTIYADFQKSMGDSETPAVSSDHHEEPVYFRAADDTAAP